MKVIFQLLLISIALSACAIGGQRAYEIHVISMNETIDDEHVKYSQGILLIDNERITLPEGENMRINYRRNSEVVRYTVRVDGELVEEAEIFAET